MRSLSFLAGAASLCIQVLCARRLAIEIGSPVAAFALAVASFMLGLAAGAAVLGRVADRSRAPLRWFGWLHLAATVPALLFAFPAASGLIRTVLKATGTQPGSTGFLLAAGLTTAPVIALGAAALGGATPLLVAACRSRGRSGTRVYAELSAAQAAGGACGALACSFVLLPWLGLSGSLAVSSLLAAATGAAALGIAREAAPTSAPSMAGGGELRDGDAPAPDRASAFRLATAALATAMCGLALTGLEVVWTRMTFLSFGASSQAVSLVLAGAILGLAVGCALAARFPDALYLSTLASAGAIVVVLTDPLLSRLPLAGAWGSAAAAAAFPLVAIPCVVIGAALPACFALFRRLLPAGLNDGRAAGLASACSSAGTCLGPPLAWLGLQTGLGVRGCLIAAACLLALAGVLASDRARHATAGALALLLALAAPLMIRWDVDLLSSGRYLYGTLYEEAAGSDPAGGASQGGGASQARGALQARGEILFVREGPEALVTVRRSRTGTLSLQVNGKTDASSGGDMKTQVLVAQLPLALHAGARAPSARPPRTLVIGLGSGVTAGSALTHGGDVEVVEISPEVVEAAARFEAENRHALANPRLTLHVADARARLIFGPESLYDVIVSQPSNPWIAGQAILFTREFFELAKVRLAQGGLYAQWLQGYGLHAEDFRSVVATFAQVFPQATLWEESTAGGDYLLIGAEDRWRIDLAALEGALTSPAVAADLDRIEVRGMPDLLAHYVAGPAEIGRFARGAELQVEDRLALEFTAPPALRQETLGPILRVLEPYRSSPAGWAPAGSPLAAALERRAREARQERRWAEGLGLFDPASSRDPELLRALSFLKAGMREHARGIVASLARRDPGKPLPFMILGHLAMRSGDSMEAARAFSSAAAADPNSARIRMTLSRTLLALGHVTAALEHNEAARRLDPVLPEAASDRCALLMMEAGPSSPPPQEAEACCVQAIEADPGLAEAHANMGVLRARQGRLDMARAAYQRSLSLDPGLQDARYNLATLAEREGRPREGLLALAPLLEGPAEPDPGILALASRLADSAGDPELARGYRLRGQRASEHVGLGRN